MKVHQIEGRGGQELKRRTGSEARRQLQGEWRLRKRNPWKERYARMVLALLATALLVVLVFQFVK